MQNKPNHSTPRKPELIIIAGPNGSGKTTITSDLLNHYWMDGKTYINPDKIAEDFLDGWNDSTSILEAARQAEALREDYIKNKVDFAFETVFSTTNKVAFLRRSKEQGYFIRLFFISTKDPKINISRIQNRLKSGGHGVPDDKVIKRYANAIKHIQSCITECDRSYVYDNSEENKQPALQFRAKNNTIAKIYGDTMPLWLKDIYQAFSNKPRVSVKFQ